MSKRKLFTKFIKVVNTTKQCSLKDMYSIVTYNLSFDLSLVYDFNTVDSYTLTYTMIVGFSNAKGQFYSLLTGFKFF